MAQSKKNDKTNLTHYSSNVYLTKLWKPHRDLPSPPYEINCPYILLLDYLHSLYLLNNIDFIIFS